MQGKSTSRRAEGNFASRFHATRYDAEEGAKVRRLHLESFCVFYRYATSLAAEISSVGALGGINALE